MKYDFDQPTARRGTNSYKWDSEPDAGIIPMWVADMDFRTAPVVIRALEERVQHGIFGYTHVPQEFYRSITRWFSQRHGWSFSEDWILYTSGVVPALSATIKAFTLPGDKVIVQTPVYNCFFSSIRNNGCEAVQNSLLYADGTYTIDFDGLERLASDPRARLLLLCNPHNPAGRVWTRDELQRVGDICLRHGVAVVADEIHCEFVSPGHTYVPYGSLGGDYMHNAVILNAPSKAFNTAGLQIAYIVCERAGWRERIDRAININEVCDVNPFGVAGLIAAYTDEGAEWLRQLNEYLFANYRHLCDFFREELPEFPVTTLEGTYLVWVDCSALGMGSDDIEERLLREDKVWVNAGSMYGDDRFIRINIACPRQRMNEGLRRIATGLRRLLAAARG